MTEEKVRPIGPPRWRPFLRDPETGHRGVYVQWDFPGFQLSLVAVVGVDYGVEFKYLEIDNAKAITAGTLQQIRLGELREQVATAFRNRPELMDWDALTVSLHDAENNFRIADIKEGKVVEVAEEDLDAKRTRLDEVKRLAEEIGRSAPRRGRGAKNPDHFARVASLYLKLLADPQEGGVIKAMARELDAKPNTVSQWVRKARLNGWLTEAPGQGRAGGEARQKLEEWRKDHES